MKSALELWAKLAERMGMEIQFQFKNMKSSTRLTQLARAEFESIGELVLQETFWTVNFTAKKKSCEIEVFIHSSWGDFKAASEGHDFMMALTSVSHRIEKQILKKKSRLQDHKAA